jgi:hypothetical protein
VAAIRPIEEEGARVARAWVDWLAALGSSIVDPGTPFGPSLAIAPGGTDAEGAPTRLMGYTIFTAENLAAVELAKGCPPLTSGATAVPGTVAVYEMLQV